METLAQGLTEHREGYQAMQASIRSVMHLPAGSSSAQTALGGIAAQDPELFFESALAILEAIPDSPARPRLYDRLLGCAEFKIQLTRLDRFSYVKLLETCRNFQAIDNRLDVKLADLLPGRREDKYK